MKFLMCLFAVSYGLNSVASGFQEKKIRFWSIPGNYIYDVTKYGWGKSVVINDDVGDGYFNALKETPAQITCGHQKYGSYIFSQYHALSFKFKDEAECMKAAKLFSGTKEETPFDVTGRWVIGAKGKNGEKEVEYFQVENVGPALGKVQ